METDDKQSAVEIVISLCDVVFENIDLAACLRPLVSCLSLKIALSVDSSLLFIKDICRNVGSSRSFVQLLAFLVLGFLRDLGDEPSAIKNIVFVDSLEIKVNFEVSDNSLLSELICPKNGASLGLDPVETNSMEQPPSGKEVTIYPPVFGARGLLRVLLRQT